MMLRKLRCLVVLSLLALVTVIAPPAFADTAAPAAARGTTANPYVSAGETAAGTPARSTEITALFSSIMNTAVAASQSIQQESDKFASGLAVITIVLAAVRFAATKDPVMAWVALFEELGIRIFASIYVGFASWAPNFYKWFVSMQRHRRRQHDQRAEYHGQRCRPGLRFRSAGMVRNWFSPDHDS